MAAAISASTPFTIPATAQSITSCSNLTRDALHGRGESFLQNACAIIASRKGQKGFNATRIHTSDVASPHGVEVDYHDVIQPAAASAVCSSQHIPVNSQDGEEPVTAPCPLQYLRLHDAALVRMLRDVAVQHGIAHACADKSCVLTPVFGCCTVSIIHPEFHSSDAKFWP